LNPSDSFVQPLFQKLQHVNFPLHTHLTRFFFVCPLDLSSSTGNQIEFKFNLNFSISPVKVAEDNREFPHFECVKYNENYEMPVQKDKKKKEKKSKTNERK